MSKPIYDHSPLYFVLRLYVDWCTKRCYRRCSVSGRENIPEGAVILAPNHSNALMDALVVLRSRKEATVFGARADAFKPVFVKALAFLKILPLVRRRDGLRNVIKNKETQKVIVECLDNDVKFCMFCEGTHRPMHSLLPVTKGILRLAMEANASFGNRKHVYIVPVGIEYGDYFRYMSVSSVRYGKAIDVTELFAGMEGAPDAHKFEALRRRLGEEMSGLFTFLADDERYEEKWSLVKTASAAADIPFPRVFDFNRGIARKVDSLTQESPELASWLLNEAGNFDRERKRLKISYRSLGKRHSFARLVFRTAGMLLLFPYFLFCTVTMLPMLAAAAFICSRIKDPAFLNTARFGIKLVMTPLMFILWAAIFFFYFCWPAAVILLLLTLPAYGAVYMYAEGLRVLFSDFRLYFNRTIRNRFVAVCNDMRAAGLFR